MEAFCRGDPPNGGSPLVSSRGRIDFHACLVSTARHTTTAFPRPPNEWDACSCSQKVYQRSTRSDQPDGNRRDPHELNELCRRWRRRVSFPDGHPEPADSPHRQSEEDSHNSPHPSELGPKRTLPYRHIPDTSAHIQGLSAHSEGVPEEYRRSEWSRTKPTQPTEQQWVAPIIFGEGGGNRT